MYQVFTDGACKGNPGPAGIGYVIYSETGEKIYEHSSYIGEGTNNIAEYTALLEAVKTVKNKLSQKDEKVVFHLDSELIVKQMNGAYKIKNSNLKSIFFKIVSEIHGMNYEITHVGRESNKEADYLSKKALNLIK